MNPGMSFDSTVVFPIFSASARVVSQVASLVCVPRMISTSCMSGTGFMKCIPITRSGFWTLAAMRVMGIDEVLEARTAFCGMVLARLAKTFFFTSSFSVTASTAYWAARASSVVPAFRRARVA